MAAITRYIWIMLLVLGVAGLALGIVFLVNGFSAKAQVAESLQAEQVTLGLTDEQKAAGEVVDTAAEAQAAQDVLAEHLHDRYGTYGDTSRGSSERDTYIDGTTLRNSLNLANLGFGVSTMAIGSGVAMVVIGVGLVGTGIVLQGRR